MSKTADPIAVRLEFARDAALEAGQLTRRFFQKNVSVELKGDDSPVTVADREAERLLRERIAGAFPEDGILGEEFDEQPGQSGYRWIVDPIDGTKSFISGVPLYSTLVAVEFEGRSRIGVINLPALDECVYAAEGRGCRYRGPLGTESDARVDCVSELSKATFVTTQVDSFAPRGAEEVYRRLESVARVTRTWGDGYGYFLVATGRAHVMVDPEMSLWDIAALQPVVEEAGGTLTDWSGEPTIHSGEAVASCGGKVAEQVLAVTRDHAKPA